MAEPTRDITPAASAPGSAVNPLHHVPVEVTVAVGRARPTIGELLTLGQGAVLALDRKLDDPVEIYVGERLIARGELEDADEDGGLAVRLTEIADLQSGL